MPKNPIREAQPGQKLIRPAVPRAGMVMMQPGTELTAPIIERLAHLGIDSVFIEGPQSSEPKPRDEALRELEERFRGHENDKWMMELKAIVRRQLGPPPPPYNG